MGDLMKRVLLRLIVVLLCVVVAIYSIVFSTEFLDASPLQADIQNKCTKHGKDDPSFVPRPSSGRTVVVHLTNEGEFADRCEFTDALDEIVWDHCADPVRAASEQKCFNEQLIPKPDAVSKPKLIVLYTHGWMHSADEKDHNFEQFKALVRRLASSRADRQVLGIYIGWNGSTGSSILDYFSFWSRQRVADRITQSAIIAKMVGAIGNVRGGSGKRDNFVAIGHSFGARMLFAAVNAPLIIDVERAYPKPNTNLYQMVRGPADAVLLLNPAFEASRYTAIDSFMRNEETFASNQPPLIITVSTDNDWATRTAFPLGQMLGLSFDERAQTTLGNYEPYYTHSLMRSNDACAPAYTLDIAEQFYASKLCLRRETSWHNEKREQKINVTKDPFRWSIVAPERQKYNPFLLVHTNKEVIDNHGGIWEPPFSDWIFEVVKAMDAAATATKHLP
jgi:hypothetical protein